MLTGQCRKIPFFGQPTTAQWHQKCYVRERSHERRSAGEQPVFFQVDLVLLSVATLPVNVRDPDEVDLLALALHLGVPVWSKDNGFEDAGVEWYETAGLLKKLGA